MRKWLLDARVRYSAAALAIVALAAAGVWMLRTPEPSETPSPQPEPESEVPAGVRLRIDRWIEEHKFNRFGDPLGTRYTGGTPLFDPRSGKYKDRYAYILERHPELKAGK